MFPFLIGRIRTGIGKVKARKLLEFPFLIGRIRTYNLRDYVVVREFPFLIGRIRTRLAGEKL